MSENSRLPIYQLEDSLVKALGAGRCARLVLEAPTGSGKSTQVPQMLIDRRVVGHGEVVVLQPRRLAARMLARRVARERDGRLGEEVGYQIRFENATSPATRIRYVTEGVLLRQLLRDPTLESVEAVLFDEFHERHFHGDVTLARCLEIQEERRPDLKLVVMSATVDSEPLERYLDPCEVLASEGRSYPVGIHYRPAKQRHKDGIGDHVARVLADHLRSQGVEGHILVFLPGAYEIRQVQRALEKASWCKGFRILPLYGELSARAQDEAVEPSATPKIVLATNVAETSLTIDGVRVVVDSGLERRASFDARRGIETLTVEKISRASADQRAGRAGRTAEGVCLRLWSEDDHANRDAQTPPEILRMDLSEAVLTLKATGVEDVETFRWFEPPSQLALAGALKWLAALGAVESGDGSRPLTPLGRQLSRLPLSPRYGRVLLEAARFGCLEFFAVAAASSQGRSLFPRRKEAGAQRSREDYRDDGDASDYHALWRAFGEARDCGFDRQRCQEMGVNAAAAREIARMAEQFVRAVGKHGRDQPQDRVPDAEEVGRLLLTGFFDRVARRMSPGTLSCAVEGGRRGTVVKGSVAARRETRLFLVGEIIEIEGRELEVRLDANTLIEEAWLRDAFPDEFHERSGATWDESARRVEAREERVFRDLVIERKSTGAKPDPAEAARILAVEVMEGRLVLKRWDDKAQQWIARVNTLAAAAPELEIAPIDAEARQLILEEVCAGATGYKEIKEREVMPALKRWVPAHQAYLLDQWVPERIDLSNGRSARVRYAENGKPKISLAVQQLFGVQESPRVAQGRVPVVVELLAPNQRPVQVTEDLAGFWKGSYAAVRSQLRGRYPKHAWPEPGELPGAER